jgi:glucokinase
MAAAMADELILGLDVGGTKCVALLGTRQGEILKREQWASEACRGAEHMLESLRCQAQRMASEAAGTITAAGAAVGGPMDAEGGIVLSPPNLPGWDRIPLKALMEQWLQVPAHVEHDAAACAMAEYLWGGWGKPRGLGYLTCGTGFGLGLVVNGKPFGGAGGRRPEVGHWRLREDGPVAFGKSGSAEAFCSGSGLAKIAAWRFPERWGVNPPGGQELNRLASAGDGQAKAVIAENAKWTGRVCSMLADLLTPEVITLGSLARYLGASWLDQVRSEFARETEAGAALLTRIEPAGLGHRIGDLSALAAACIS